MSEPVDLVGAWRLKRWETVYRDGRRTEPFGARATGLLQYTADGWMSANIMAAGRPKLSGTNPRRAHRLIWERAPRRRASRERHP